MEVKVSKEFENYLPPIDKETEKILEESIKQDGVRDPIIVWKGKNIIVDGHNRYRIATKLNKTFKTEEREFKNADEVRLFMLRTQLARRNLSRAAASEARGRMVKLMRQTQPLRGSRNETISQIAKEQGVSTATVKRDAVFAEGLDKLRAKNKEEAQKVSAGTSNINKKTIEKLGTSSGKDEKTVMKQALDEAKRQHKQDTSHRTEPPKTDTKEEKIYRAVKKMFAATDTAGRRAAINDMIRVLGEGHKMLPELEDRNADLKGIPDDDTFND